MKYPDKWKHKKEFWLRYPVVEYLKQPVDDREKIIVGPYGQIWEWSDTVYACQGTNPVLNNKIAPRYGLTPTYTEMDELFCRFPKSDLESVATILEISTSPVLSEKYANDFYRLKKGKTPKIDKET